MSRINHLYEGRYQFYTYAYGSWPLTSEGYLACDMRHETSSIMVSFKAPITF